MTQDALQKANQIQQQINAASMLKANHLSRAQTDFKELTAAQLATITTALTGIHDAIITGLQQQLTALDGNYTKPVGG